MSTPEPGQAWASRYPDRSGHRRVAHVEHVQRDSAGLPTHVVSIGTYRTRASIKSFLARYELLDDDDATPEDA